MWNLRLPAALSGNRWDAGIAWTNQVTKVTPSRAFCSFLHACVTSEVGTLLSWVLWWQSYYLFTVIKRKQQCFNAFIDPFLVKKRKKNPSFLFPVLCPRYAHSQHNLESRHLRSSWDIALGSGWMCRSWNWKGTNSCKWGIDICKNYELWFGKPLSTKPVHICLKRDITSAFFWSFIFL